MITFIVKEYVWEKNFSGQKIDRLWLIYSEITGKLFCELCRCILNNYKNSYLTSKWYNVLTRILTIIKKLNSHRIPLRGHDEIIGSVNNGNFLMIIELLSEYDLFLSQRITRFKNPGSGITSCLSHTIYEGMIKLMANKVKNDIITQIKTNIYYSIIVDSTSDISSMN